MRVVSTFDKDKFKCYSKFKRKSKITVGYSHHNEGSLALLAAYTLGAEILEFHFTDDRKGKSLEITKYSESENGDLYKNISNKKYLGSSIKLPQKFIKHVKTFRRSIYARNLFRRKKYPKMI